MHLWRAIRGGFAIAVVVCLLVIVSLALPLKAHANGTTYYVDAVGGNDNNNGQSTGSAWQSLAKVNSTTFQPGDRILFLAGDTWNGQLHPLGSGNSSSPITIDTYGSGNKPVIAGGGSVAATVYLYNQQYWEINNLEVTNNGSGTAARVGVNVVEQDQAVAEHIHISNLYVHNVDGYVNGYYGQNAGISVEAGLSTVQPTSHWDDVLIQNNTVTTVDRIGIFVGPLNDTETTNNRSTNVVIQHNTVSDSGGDAILTYVTSGALVQYNVSHDDGGRSGEACQSSYCNQCAADMWTVNSDHSTFQYNEAYNQQNGCDGEGFDNDWGTSSSIFQYNYSHNNRGGFFLDCRECGPEGTDAILRYNISQNDGRCVLCIAANNSDTSNEFQVYNNTFYVASGLSSQIVYTYNGQPVVRPFTFTNNIVDIQGSGSYQSTPGSTYDHNVFFGNHPSSEPADANKLTSDPLLANPGSGGTGLGSVSGYELQTGSPAIGSGVLVSNNGGQDFYGNAVSSSSAPNRGAYNGAGVAATTSNLVGNPGFESGSLSPWSQYGNANVVASNAHSGTYAVQTGASSSAAEQVVTGLSPNTTYTLTGWAEVANAGESVYIGVKEFGGNETSAQFTGTSYTQTVINFTTGSSNTSARIYCYKNSGSGAGYCDDFTVEPDLVGNPGFESGSLSPWVQYGGASVVASNAHSGTYAVQIGASSSAAEQVVTGLSPNTTYTLSGWAEVANAGEGVYIGVKEFGGNETNIQVTSTSYTQATMTFTTGSSNTSARIYCYKASGSGAGYCDDLSVTQAF